MQNTLYQFLYNSNVHESGWTTMSIHHSEEGAKRAMEEHKEKEWQKFLVYDQDCMERDPEFEFDYPNVFGEYQDWTVQPIEIKP